MFNVQRYTDMTKYQFLHFENAYNIGWCNDNFENEYNLPRNIKKVKLDFSHANYIDVVFLEKLKIHCNFRFNVCRGGVFKYHYVDGKKYVKGFGQIRIFDLEKGIKYATTNLIYDDIEKYIEKNPKMLDCVTNKGSLLNYAIILKKEKEVAYLIDRGTDINIFYGI